MGQYSDLFVAAEADAHAIAVSDDRYTGWHSASLKNVLELEWMAFAKAARTDVFGEPLFLDEVASCAVCAMTGHVQQRLAGLSAADRRTLAQTWRACAEQFAAWPDEAVDRVLVEVCALAQRAQREGKAVLYLSTW